MAFNLLDQRIPYAHASRATRVRELLVLADALVAGKGIERRAAVALGNAIQRWLTAGGDLETHLGVRAPPGSRHTAAYFARRFSQTLHDQMLTDGSSRGARQSKNSVPISSSRDGFAKVD